MHEYMRPRPDETDEHISALGVRCVAGDALFLSCCTLYDGGWRFRYVLDKNAWPPQFRFSSRLDKANSSSRFEQMVH